MILYYHLSLVQVYSQHKYALGEFLRIFRGLSKPYSYCDRTGDSGVERVGWFPGGGQAQACRSLPEIQIPLAPQSGERPRADDALTSCIGFVLRP